MGENLILNREVLVNVCDLTNSFEAFEQKKILAAILNLNVSHDWDPMRHIPNYCIHYSEQKSSSELTWLEQLFGSYLEKSVIWSSSWKMADCATLPPLANVHHRNSYSINCYASSDIWHIFWSLKLPRDQIFIQHSPGLIWIFLYACHDFEEYCINIAISHYVWVW